MENLIRTLKALSDPNRLRIMKLLEERSLCLCEIVSILKLANSTVSQHLSVLKEAGLIVDEKDGKWVNFIINKSPESVYVKELLERLGTWINSDEVIMRDKKLIQKTDRKDICS